MAERGNKGVARGDMMGEGVSLRSLHSIDWQKRKRYESLLRESTLRCKSKDRTRSTERAIPVFHEGVL